MKFPFSKLQQIDALKISEAHPDGYEYVEYTRASLAAKLGNEEWFLAYAMNSQGVVEDHDEHTTYSVAFSKNGLARVRTYVLAEKSNGEKSQTTEADSVEGVWDVDKQLLILVLPNETMEFVVSSIENGIAMLVDPDDGNVSVLMTQETFKAEAANLSDD